MALVNFHRLDAATYAGIDTKQPDTIYFVTDARRIYMGDKEYGLQVVSGTRPGTGSLNTLYIDSAAHTISYWNGTSYNSLEIPFGTTISGTGDDSHLATTKAVVDYVASKLTDLDVGALEGRVDTLETEMDTAQGDITTIKGQITTISGEGEGSIKKAASDAQTAAVAAAKSYTDTAVANKADLEHTHEIDDVTGLQAALNGKADKSTTLAGYGIGDAYTKGQTDSAIASAVAAAPHLKRTIVEALPDAGSADQNTIYMVGTGAGSEDSAYEEYMLINGAFERIGTSDVDLTNYATKTYVDQAKTDAVNAAKSYTDTEVAEAIETAATNASSEADAAETAAKTYADGLIAALDKTDSAQAGQYVSAVSQENGVITVQRATLPTAPEITTGGTNGTIKVGEEEVAVAGLKSAAYTDASDYATAEQGAKADTAVQEVTEGTANGTILVDGTSVAVHGLGAAAYTDTTAYATAAQGTKADQVFAALTWQEG